MKASSILTLAVIGCLSYFALCPSAPDVSLVTTPKEKPLTMVDESPVIEPVTEPAAIAEEELAHAIVKSVIDAIAECPLEHKLIATFEDGSTAYMPIPPFDELMQAMGGDITIFERELLHVVKQALEMGAVQFDVIDTTPEDNGTQV